MRRHSQVFLEMVISRLVDNFQRYVSELLREVLRRQPNILKTSDKSLSMDDVLRFERMEDLIADVIERRVSALSYQGFGSIQEWCQGKGIPHPAVFAPGSCCITLSSQRPPRFVFGRRPRTKERQAP